VLAAAAAIAAPDTDLPALEEAALAARGLGASVQEQPVWAGSIPLGGRNTLAGTLLRSPDGGYLFGLAERYVTEPTEPSGATRTAAAVSAQTFSSPDTFMAAVAVDGEKEVTPKHVHQHLLVIAPAGADRVSSQGVTVKVNHRLAIIDLPAPSYGEGEDPLPPELSEVKALDAAGRTLQTVTILSQDGGDSGRPAGNGSAPGRADVGTQSFGDYMLMD
jgi:hypothetical protein